MQIDVVLLPAYLNASHLGGRSVAVFDVLRATSTIAYGLAAGMTSFRLFSSVEAVRSAAANFSQNASGGVGDSASPSAELPSAALPSADRPLLIGETRCLRPEGFDFGNSPAALTSAVAGRSALMSTTNGAVALLAAASAAERFTAALVNARAAAAALWAAGRDITLLCSGTSGQISMEDMIGCGAVIAALESLGTLQIDSDSVRACQRLFEDNRHRLPRVLSQTQGGHNVITAGLPADVDACAALDRFDVVGHVAGQGTVVTRYRPPG